MASELETTIEDLEGEYVIVSYGMSDYSGEYWGLNLYEVEYGEAKVMLAPTGNAENIPLYMEQLLRFVEREKIREVYAPRNLGKVGLRETVIYFSDEPDEDGFQPWGEFKPCYEWNEDHEVLEDAGVRVNFV